MIGTAVTPTPPIPRPPAQHNQISLPAAALDRFVGRYEFGPGFVIAITRGSDGLHAQREGIEGAPALPIYPEAPLAFFWKAVDAQLRFTTDESGAVTGAEFTQGVLKLTGKKMTP